MGPLAPMPPLLITPIEYTFKLIGFGCVAVCSCMHAVSILRGVARSNNHDHWNWVGGAITPGQVNNEQTRPQISSRCI